MATAACPDSQAPSAPSGLKVASATQASISLSWKASSDNVGVSGYDVYNGGTKAGSTSGTSYTLSGLACGSAYTLAVDAFDAAGNLSSKTSVSGSTAACAPSDTQAPSVPQNQRMTGATQTSISMSWSASSDNVGVSGYNLYRDGTKVGSTTQTSYTFSGLKCGTTYTLGLSAFDAAGNESDPSQAEGSASTSACPSSGDTQPPTTPTGLAVSGASQSGMTLSWNASSDNVGVTAYDVYNGTQLMGSVTSRSYSYTGLQCGTTYSLGVAARDAAGNVSPKATASGQTAACSGGGSGGDVFISPNGSDSAACTQSAPCKSFDRAYHVAGPGDVVIVAAGTYPGQTLTADGSKAPTASIANVVFQPASGASVSVSGELRVEGSHVEFHDMSFGDWYAGINSNIAQSSQTAHLGFYNVTAKSFYDHASYVDIIGGSYGPLTDDATQVSDCYQCNYSPQHITVDGVYFHDFVRKTDGIHMECLHVYAASYLTVRNSRFYNCAIMDLFINNYSGSPDIHDIVVENNFFDTPGSHGGSLSDGSYSLYVTPYFSGRSISNVTVRNNSSLGTLLIDNGTQGATIKNAEMANNLSEMAGYQCIGSGQGVTYSHNVWYSGSSTTKACGSTDKALSGGSSAAGYVNVSSFDLHLTNSSPAVNAGDPNDTPATDIDGQHRPMGSAPDAGADEHS
jgi:chitodextrinase